MRFIRVCLMGLFVFVHAVMAQEQTISGKVRLADGRAVAGAAVVLFDLADLHRGAVARAMTDESGHFALPLASLGRSALPQGFALGPNYPNPFNPSTMIPYQLPTAAHVRLDVFNVLGQHVATLVDAERPAGFHAAQWGATDAAGQAMAAGVYFYRLTAGGGQQTQRMVLIDGQAGIAATPSTAATISTEAVERDYGLVVSGEGLTTYADAAFGVRVGTAAIELVVDAAPLAGGNVSAGDILGDVNNDRQVGLEDAMLVAVSRSNPSIVMPNNGSLGLGDVNGDGQVDLTDVQVLMRYMSNPLDGALPVGVGQRIGSGKRVSDDSGVIRLSDDEGKDLAPDWSPDGRQIAFQSSRNNNVDIYVMAADGSDMHQLTDNDARDENPSWSPDGRQIAFSSTRNDNFEIYVMAADGSDVHQLTDNDARDENPSWSPDGRQIAFSSTRKGRSNFDIYVMDSDGSNPHRLTDHPAWDRSPSWSPDGRQIAFSSDRDGNSDIYVMAADGSDVHQLTDNDARDRSPSWSPDGRQIVFSSDRDGNSDIYVMGSDGSNPRRLTNHKSWDVQPSWSADGEQIVFSSDRDGNLGIYVMEIEESIVDLQPTEESIVDLQPTFSDSDRVADRTVTEGEEMHPLELPAGSDGAGDLTYSLSPEVPGLTFDATARTLSGTPTVAGAYALIYRVEDSNGAEAELRFTVTVKGKPIVDLQPTEESIVDLQPTFSDSDRVADRTVTEGEEMHPLELPAGSDGAGDLTYSLSPEVPGLTFDATARTLSGTPTVAGAYALIYRVEDSNGAEAELRFTVTVKGKPIVDLQPTEESIVDLQPTFSDSDRVADRTVTEGEEMHPLELPAGSDGAGDLTYSLSPEVPGLTFDATARTLSGTPTVAGAYALIYRVEDSNGAEAELTFVLRVDVRSERMVELPGGASMEFAWIEPGVFQMGSDTGRTDERPVHEVEISRGFWLGKYEITQGQWKAVMNDEPWSGRKRVISDPSYPAVIISWDEVQEFISRLNAAVGEELYRLPTEAEWEYACRAGTQTPWSFGDDESQLKDYAWYFGNPDAETEGAKKVGSRQPNPWGLYDMHGNVWEWVQDWYDEDYYNSSPRVDPQGPTSGLGRVIRGGHFGHIDGVRSAYRHLHSPDSRSYTIGVRLLKVAGD